MARALIGAYVSMTTDFVVGTFVGGVAYVASFYWLKKLRNR